MMLKESNGKYIYRCVFCDAIKCCDDLRAVIYCNHNNGFRVLMTRKPAINFRDKNLRS